jgi:hypothetical protein
LILRCHSRFGVIISSAGRPPALAMDGPRARAIEGQKMTFHDGTPVQPADAYDDTPAGALVVTVYRCAMAGFSVGRTDCWDVGWKALGAAMPPGEAGALFGQFYGFVRALLACAQKPLSWRPANCRGLCGDEALALSMIEAAQRGDPANLLAHAALLLGVDELGDALQATQSLATALARRGLFVRAARDGEPCGFDLCPLRRLH